MIIALAICVIFIFFVWRVFFKFRWLKFTAVWGVVSAFILIHVVLAALIGLRFVTPSSVDAQVIQHAIQLVPRLLEPTASHSGAGLVQHKIRPTKPNLWGPK